MKEHGIIAGVFDLFHTGHIHLFKEARKVCKHLTVAVNCSDSKPNLIMTASERVEIVKGCRYVDRVIPYYSEEYLLKLIEKSDIRIIGSDYFGKDFTGKNVCVTHYVLRTYLSSNIIRNRCRML